MSSLEGVVASAPMNNFKMVSPPNEIPRHEGQSSLIATPIPIVAQPPVHPIHGQLPQLSLSPNTKSAAKLPISTSSGFRPIGESAEKGMKEGKFSIFPEQGSDKNAAVSNEKIAELMAFGKILRAKGNFDHAIRIYDEILKFESKNVEALNCKGVCFKQIREPTMAMMCYDAALSISPQDWCAHNNKGVLYKEAGLFQEAITCYSLAIEHGPKLNVAKENMAIVLNELGSRLKSVGCVDGALAKYQEALHFNPTYAPAYFNLGFLYSELDRLVEAVECYNAAINHHPEYIEAFCNIGVILKNSGRLEDAISYYEKALALNPNFDIVKNNLAIAYTDLGTKVKQEQSVQHGIPLYKKALFYNSKYAHAWYNLGVAYAEVNQMEDAVISYEMSIQLNPEFAEAYNNLGVLTKELGNYAKSIQCYEAALRINPNFSQTLNNLGVIYTMLGKMTEGYEYCIMAIKVNPSYAEAYNNLGVLYRDEGRISEAVENYEKCLLINDKSRNAGQNRLLALNYAPVFPIAYVSEQHRLWGLKFCEDYKSYKTFDHILPLSAAEGQEGIRPLRIGYVSPDFCTHSVSYFIEAPLRSHTKNVQVFCYSNVPRPDNRTDLLRSYGGIWKDIHGLEADVASELIRADKIDILVDLTGHTAGNRLDIFAMKPAPVQVTWIGYPNSSGLPTMDFRITDDVVDPYTSKQTFVENLVRLSGPFLCYSPPQDLPEVSAPPAISNKFITFGSFNNLAKITDQVIGLWCKVLHAVPSSRMLLKCKPFATARVSERVLKIFEDYGIQSYRLDLVSLLPKTADHLSMYSSVDIALDSFPYAGTTTTCEALVMGVPVITLSGSCHAQNVGKSLLSRIEILRSCITDNEDDYVKAAVYLSSDFQRLAALRSKIRGAMLDSSLCDGENHAANLEQAYLDMFMAWQSKNKI